MTDAVELYAHYGGVVVFDPSCGLEVQSMDLDDLRDHAVYEVWLVGPRQGARGAVVELI